MNIVIEGTQNTPGIIFNAEQASWIVTGRSYHKEPRVSYEPILKWLDTLRGPGHYSIEFKLEFFDTGSYKVILDILFYLKNKVADNICLSIKWFYETDDEDMKDSGESLKEITSLPLELIGY